MSSARPPADTSSRSRLEEANRLNRRYGKQQEQACAEGPDADEVHRYLLQCCSRLVIESAKREAADLRSLLRFLYLQGRTDTDLSAAAQVTAIIDMSVVQPRHRPF